MERKSFERKVFLCILECGAFLFGSAKVRAEPLPDGQAQMESDYLTQFRGELDFTDLDELLETEARKGERAPIRFSELVDLLISDGPEAFDGRLLMEWLSDALFYEIRNNRRLLAEVLLVTFSVLKNFSGAFRQAYIAEISFFLVYGILAVLLLQSFTNYEAIAEELLEERRFYEGARTCLMCQYGVFCRCWYVRCFLPDGIFSHLSCIQWLFLKVLMPLIHARFCLCCSAIFLRRKNLRIWRSF